MNDKEYVEFLEAVASEYIRLNDVGQYWRLAVPDQGYFTDPVDNLASMAQLAKLLGERQQSGRPRGTQENELLLRALGSELKKGGWDAVERMLDECGVTDALDQYGEVLLSDFRRFVVPEADLDILRRAGIERPEAALRIAEEQARAFATRRASNVLLSAGQELKKAGAELDPPKGKKPSKKPRKWFKGLTRMLAGGAGCLGNVVLGMGIMPVAAPVSAAAVLGSCTGGFIFICDGIEALQGKD
jgi:hypothetical protein